MIKAVLKRMSCLLLILTLGVALLCLYSCGGGGDDDCYHYNVYNDGYCADCGVYVGGGYNDEDYVTLTIYNVQDEPITMEVRRYANNYIGDFKKYGYEFLGLYDSPTGGVLTVDNNGDSVVEFTGDAILYAQYQIIEYTKELEVGENGELLDFEKTLTVKIGDVIDTLPLPYVDEGYEFLGWALNDGTLISDQEAVLEQYKTVSETNSFWISNQKLKAKIERKKVYLTLEYNVEGTESETFEYYYGDPMGEIDALYDDEENCIEFIGWSTSEYSYVPYEEDESFTAMKDDVTLYAIWINYKRVTFVVETLEEAFRIYEGVSFTLPSPDIPGKRIDGWFVSPLFNTIPVSNISYYNAADTYYGKTSIANYEVSFATTGDEAQTPFTYKMGEEITLPTLQRENFTFAGWCKSEDLSDSPITEITATTYGDMTLYPKFIGDSKRVILHTGMGVLSQNSANVEYYAKYQLPVPAYEGYAFLGWFADEALTTQLTDSDGLSFGIWETLENNTELYAKYAKKYYVNLNDVPQGAVITNLKPYYVAGEQVNLEITPSENYRLGGIYRDGSLVSKTGNYTFYMPAKNIDLTLKLTRIGKITVTLNGSNGLKSIDVPETAMAGEKVTIKCEWQSSNDRWGVVSVKVNGEEVRLDSSLSFIMPDGDAAVEIKIGLKRYLDVDTGDTGLIIYTYNNRYYAFVDKKMTWSDAQAYCEAFGGHLVTIDSDAEHEFVSSVRTWHSAFTENVWIGATDKDSEGNWKWVDGSSLSCTYWSSGEPNNSGGNEHYAHLVSGAKEWNDNDNGEKFYFICEWESPKNMVFPDVKAVDDVNGETVYLSIYEHNGHYYSIIRKTMTWLEAEKYCEFLGGYLASVETESENVYIRDLRKLTGIIGSHLWIGGTDEASEGNWKWMSGASFGFTSWAKSQPDNASSKEHYLHLYSDGDALTWNDCPNEKTYQFICEWDKKSDIGKIRYGNFYNVISTREEFIQYLLNADSTAGRSYELKKDIDLSGVEWTSKNFDGTFNGNGHTLKNLTVRSDGENLGVFLNVSGSIKNLKFQNLSIESTATSAKAVGGLCATLSGTLSNIEILSGNIASKGSAGGIVGKMTGGEISDCINRASVTSTVNNGSGYGVGGIAGVATGGTVKDSENYGAISGASFAGGIIGSTAGNSSLTITNLINRGEVSSTGDYTGGIVGYYSKQGTYDIHSLQNIGSISGASYVGGIIGKFDDSSDAKTDNAYSVSFDALSNKGTVTASGDRVGGIFGDIYATYYRSGYSGKLTLVLQSTVNEGDVTGRYYVGGLIGYAYTDSGESNVIASSSSASISGSAYIGGIAGKLESLHLVNPSNEGTSISATGTLIDGSTNYAFVGGYVGYAVNSNISGAVNRVDIDYSALACIGGYVGGIAGKSTGTLNSCTNYASVNAPNSAYVGGIAGEMAETYTYSCTSLTNSGNVTGKTEVGGIFGRVYNYLSGKNSDTHNVEFGNFTNSGEITASGEYAGGLIGYMYLAHYYDSSRNGKIIFFFTGAENTGDVSGLYFVGGIFGYAYTDTSDSTMTDAQSSASLNATAYVGGIAGKIEYINLINPSNEGSTICATGSRLDSSSNKWACIGGYVGSMVGATISGAINNVDIDYSGPMCIGGEVGGIAGASSSTFENCQNNGTVNAPGATRVGGICGNLYRTYTYTVSELENTGKITGKDTVGGIFGRVYNQISEKNSNSYTVTLETLKNSGTVLATGDFSGGLIGYMNMEHYYDSSRNGKIILFFTGAENTGDVSGQYYVGGIFGYGFTDTVDSTVADAKSCANISAVAYVGGIAGRLEYFNLTNPQNAGSTISASGTRLVDSTKYACVGGYVGSFQYSSISGAVNNADIDYSSALAVGLEVGGICGSSKSIITNCQNNGTIYAPYASYVGGIAGCQYKTGSFNLTELVNTGAVTGVSQVGGIFGRLTNSTSDKSNPAYTMTLTKLQSKANVTASGDYAGALFGYVDVGHYYDGSRNGSVTLYVSESAVEGTVTGNKYVGGIIGYINTDNTESKAYSITLNTTVMASESFGNYVGYADDFTVLE